MDVLCRRRTCYPFPFCAWRLLVLCCLLGRDGKYAAVLASWGVGWRGGDLGGKRGSEPVVPAAELSSTGEHEKLVADVPCPCVTQHPGDVG